MVRFFIKVLTVIFIACVLSLILDFIYRHNNHLPYRYPKGLWYAPSIKQKYDLVALGNSHSEDGLIFNNYKIKWLSLASVAQTFEYDLAMLKMRSNQINKNAVIIINVSPISFSQHKPTSADDVNINYYDGRLSPFLIPHFKLSEYLQIQVFPLLRSGYLWRSEFAAYSKKVGMKAFVNQWNKKYAQANGKDALDELFNLKYNPSIPSDSAQQISSILNSPAATTDAKLEESMHFMVNKWSDKQGFSKEWFATNRQDLQSIIDYCLERHWRPVLISIPISKTLQNNLGVNFYNTYVYDNLKKINTKGAPYFNFTNDTKITEHKDLFSNSDHLNAKGGSIFSYLLLQKLIEQGYLSKNVDNYKY